MYADVAHPVNAKSREMIQNRVVEELNRELQLAAEPGYQPRYNDDYFDDDPGPQALETPEVKASDTESSEIPPGTPASTRIDPAEQKPYKTHNPPFKVNEQANSSDEDFGKGVFE